jgi:hypothetical protein
MGVNICLTLREERRLRVWANRVLRKIFGPKGNEVDYQEVGRGRGDWMALAQDRDRWRALVGTVRDFRVS